LGIETQYGFPPQQQQRLLGSGARGHGAGNAGAPQALPFGRLDADGSARPVSFLQAAEDAAVMASQGWRERDSASGGDGSDGGSSGAWETASDASAS
jgi:hypothetical protein